MEPAATDLTVSVAQDVPIPIDARFDCAAGRLLALVGPSGSGKSTLLRMIAGLVRPAQGRIQCAGQAWFDSSVARHVPARRRRVGFVPQHYGLFPHLTALGNAMAGLHHLPRAERARQAMDWLQRMNLGGLADRRPAELSGGQQQRVALARALARDPAVLLLDEPFSAVDRITRERLYGELAEVKGGLSIPVVLVTHDLSEGMMLADRLAILSGGRTLQIGEPHAVRERPVSEEVARLVGIRNLFDAEIVAHDAGRLLTVLRFGPYPLESRHRPELGVGTRVRWAIPGSGVLLHRRDRPSRGEAENPVDAVIARMIVLGDDTRVIASTPADISYPLQFEVPTHVAQRNRLAPGAGIRVTLRAEAIQVFAPTAASERPGARPRSA